MILACHAGIGRNDGRAKWRVIAIDLRRPLRRSDYDSNPQNYNLAVELGDVVGGARRARRRLRAVFIGSSGGLISLLMAAGEHRAARWRVLHRHSVLAIEPQAFARIKGYVGKLPSLRSFDLSMPPRSRGRPSAA